MPTMTLNSAHPHSLYPPPFQSNGSLSRLGLQLRTRVVLPLAPFPFCGSPGSRNRHDTPPRLSAEPANTVHCQATYQSTRRVQNIPESPSFGQHDRRHESSKTGRSRYSVPSSSRGLAGEEEAPHTVYNTLPSKPKCRPYLLSSCAFGGQSEAKSSSFVYLLAFLGKRKTVSKGAWVLPARPTLKVSLLTPTIVCAMDTSGVTLTLGCTGLRYGL